MTVKKVLAGCLVVFLAVVVHRRYTFVGENGFGWSSTADEVAAGHDLTGKVVLFGFGVLENFAYIEMFLCPGCLHHRCNGWSRVRDCSCSCRAWRACLPRWEIAGQSFKRSRFDCCSAQGEKDRSSYYACCVFAERPR